MYRYVSSLTNPNGSFAPFAKNAPTNPRRAKKRIVFLCLALLLFSSIAEAMSETDAEKFERLAKEVGLVRFINIKTEEIIAKTYTLPSGKLFLVMAVFGSKGDFRGFTTEFAVDYQPKGEIVKIISFDVKNNF